MNSPQQVLEAVRQAILVCASPAASSAYRREAAVLLDQVKAGEVHVAAELASSLVRAEELEVQHFGCVLLQHMVGVRWDEFNASDRQNLACFALQLFQDGSRAHEKFQRFGPGGAVAGSQAQSGWTLRSKAAALLALVIKRQGPDSWLQLLPTLVTFSQSGPVAAQMVCLLLRYLSDEVVQFNEDLESDARRALLSGLQASLDTVLPLLKDLLQLYFREAVSAQQAGDVEGAQLHAAVVTAALGTVLSYTEWVPVNRVGSSGLLQACCYLLSIPDYCIAALKVLTVLFGRKNTAEEAEQIGGMMKEAGQALMQLSAQVLKPALRAQLNYEGQLDEVGLTLTDAMAMFGSKYLSVLPTPQDRHAFLDQMLSFMEFPYMLLAAKSHPFWISMLKSTAANYALPESYITRLIDVAGEQLKLSARLVAQDGDVPPYFDEFEEYKRTALDYRASLLDIIRWAALRLPDQVLSIVARRVATATAVCSTSTSPAEDLATVQNQEMEYESAVYCMESVVLAWNPNPKSPVAAISTWPPPPGVQEGLQSLLLLLLRARLRPTPHLLTFHARALECFARLLELKPDLVPLLMAKVFDMFTYISLDGDPKGAPPGNPTPDWKDRFAARQRVAQALITIARTSPKVLQPHLSEQAARITAMSAAGLLWRGESNVLLESLVAASVAATPEVQSQAADWVLSPVQKEWAQPGWQANFQSPAAFIAHFMPLSYLPDGTLEVGGGLARWGLYHDLHLIERTAKRLPASPAFKPPVSPAWSPEAAQHPMNPHVAWIAGPLLQIIVCLHSVWSPESKAALSAASSALDIGPKEKALYLKKSVKDAPAQAGESDSTTIGGNSQASLRSWLRQVRELLYQACGDFCSQVGGWYQNPTGQAMWPVALVGALPIMEDWQLRLLLRHTVIVLVRSCPPSHRSGWLLPILAPLLPHLRTRLSTSWAAFLGTRGEAAAATGGPSMEDAQAADVEVIAERQMRELTQETLVLLDALRGDTVKGGGNGSAGLLDWLLGEAPATLYEAAALATEALYWPDDVSLSRATMFCRALVPYAQRSPVLEDWLSHDMLKGCFRALTYVSGNVLKAEVLHLARDLILRSLPIPSGARQELLQLPRLNPDLLALFEKEVRATGSEKEKRQLVKKLLQASGDDKLQVALSEYANGRSTIPQLAEPRAHARNASMDDQGVAFNIVSEEAACPG